MPANDKARVCCKHHPDARLHSDRETGDIICCECGLVVGDRLIEDTAEWRNFSSDSHGKDRSRVGAAEDPIFDDGNLFTVIGPVSATCKDGTVSKYLSYSTESPANKALKAIRREIEDVAERLRLPERVAYSAFALYKDIEEKGIASKHHKDARAMACLYFACHTEKNLRTILEICAKSGLPNARIRIAKAVKEIRDAAGLKEESVVIDDLFLQRYCTEFKLRAEVLKKVKEVWSRIVDRNDLGRKDSATLAGATVMLVAAYYGQGSNVSLETLVRISGTNAQVISKVYKQLRSDVERLFESDSKSDSALNALPVSAEQFCV